MIWEASCVFFAQFTSLSTSRTNLFWKWPKSGDVYWKEWNIYKNKTKNYYLFFCRRFLMLKGRVWELQKRRYVRPLFVWQSMSDTVTVWARLACLTKVYSAVASQASCFSFCSPLVKSKGGTQHSCILRNSSWWQVKYFCGLNIDRTTTWRSCVEVKVAVLGSLSLIQ